LVDELVVGWLLRGLGDLGEEEVGMCAPGVFYAGW
jgi:hypothetical protein